MKKNRLKAMQRYLFQVEDFAPQAVSSSPIPSPKNPTPVEAIPPCHERLVARNGAYVEVDRAKAAFEAAIQNAIEQQVLYEQCRLRNRA